MKRVKDGVAAVPSKRTRRDETVVEFIFTCITCWLLSVGTCLLFDAQFEFEAGIVTVLWQTLLTVIVIAVMSRKWWIPLIYVGVMILVGLIVFLVGHNFENYYDSAVNFIKWWADFMPTDSEWYSEKSFYLIHTLINMGVTLLFFAVMRITRKAWPVALLSIGILICIYMFGYTEYNILAIAFFFIGFFPMIAAEKFQGHRLFKRTNIFDIIGNRWAIALISGVICAAIAVGAISIFGSDREFDIRNRFSSNVAADIKTASNFYTVEQQAMRVTLFDLGLQSNTKYIGGSLYDIDPKILATTDLKESALMRITSYDDYNGKRWTDSFAKSYRVNGPWKDEQTAYLSGTAVEDDFIFSQLRNLAEQKEVNITLQSNSFFLPTVGQVLDLTEQTSTKNPLFFDERGQLISYFGHSTGFTYTLNSFIYQTRASLSQIQKTNVINAMDSAEDPIYTDEFIDHYTLVDEDLPEEAIKVLEMMNIDPENPYDAACKISQYFSSANGYSYTEKPPFFEKDDDIVQKLFETKEGHCVYYSTAMICMARYIGIPSRLAAGYRTVEDPDTGLQVVNAAEPYCWVECYFPNLGWIAFEPSPSGAVALAPENTPEFDEDNESGDPELGKTEDEEPEEEEEITEEPQKTFPIMAVIIPAAVLVLLVLYLGIRALLVPRLYSLESVRKRYMSTKRQAEYYWQDILRQYRGMGYCRRKGETLNELTQRVCDELIYRNEDAISEAVAVVDALHYGGITPSSEDVAKLAAACDMLDMETKWKLKPWSYFIRRRVFRPIISLKVYKADKY